MQILRRGLQHFQSTLLVGREGGCHKEYSVYALDNVDNSVRPLTVCVHTTNLIHQNETNQMAAVSEILRNGGTTKHVCRQIFSCRIKSTK